MAGYLRKRRINDFPHIWIIPCTGIYWKKFEEAGLTGTSAALDPGVTQAYSCMKVQHEFDQITPY